ncbi:MAG: DUF3137 domain-containing protein [Mobilitalea sp.]
MDKNIKNLENLRKKIAGLLTIIIGLSAIITLFFFYLFRGAQGPGLFLAILIGVGIGFLLSVVTGCNRMMDEFKDKFKTFFVEEPFRAAFHRVSYHKDQGLPQDIIDATDMMTLGNRYYTNDYVTGYYKDVKFERADVKIQQHTRTGKTSHTTTYFNGRWMIFEFNKEFHFDLQIIGNGFYYSQKNSTFFTHREERRHKLEMEDVNFNEYFTVYAQDDHEAYYILTPTFMEVLKNMHHSMDGSIMLGFVHNQLHVAINTERDAMEPSVFSSIELNNIKQDVQREIDAIIKIIDGMDLDRDIYNLKGGR